MDKRRIILQAIDDFIELRPIYLGPYEGNLDLISDKEKYLSYLDYSPLKFLSDELDVVLQDFFLEVKYALYPNELKELALLEGTIGSDFRTRFFEAYVY